MRSARRALDFIRGDDAAWIKEHNRSDAQPDSLRGAIVRRLRLMCRVSEGGPLLRHRTALWFVTEVEYGDQHPRKRRECCRHKNERSKTALEGVLVQKRPNIIRQGGG